jgi:hypothetical protein
MKSRAALHQVVISHRPSSHGSVAIDVGSGEGEIVGWLVDNGFTTYGCEVNHARATVAASRNPSATISCADVLKWDPPCAPSLVTCMELIEHLDRSEHPALLQKLRHWLPDDRSVLILSTPQQTSLVSVADRLYCRWRKLPYYWWDPTHRSILPQRLMKQELLAAGFRIVDQVGVGLVPDFISANLGPFRRVVQDHGHRGLLGAMAFDIIYVCMPTRSPHW